MPPRRHDLLTAHLPAAAWMVAMTIALAVPSNVADLPAWWPRILHFQALDKVIHGLLFLGAAMLLARSFRRLPGVERPLLAALLATCLYGGATEVGQHLFTQRRGEVADVVADVAGSAAGTLLVRWHARHRSRRPR
jgi:VanZ family protein